MIHIRKFISFILVFALLFSQPVFANVTTIPLKDIDNHWAKDSVEKWQDLQVVTGTPEGLFQPDQPIKRAELVTLINKTLGFKNVKASQFDDVNEGDWYAKAMLIARTAGYLQIYDNNTVCPNEEVTRQEAAVLIDKAFKLPETDLEISFKDQDSMIEYAKDSIARLVSIGGLEGYPDGTFRPKETITKAEFLTILDRLVGVYINQPGTYTIQEDTKGSVIVNSADVIIENSTISNNLYITEKVGDGDVTLKNTVVEGDALVQGGGENSIKLFDCKITSIIINRKEGKVRIVAEGNTSVGSATVNSNAKLESNTNKGFQYVTLDLSNDLKGFDIELEGDFGNVAIDSKANVSLLGDTQIDKVIVSGKAKPTLLLSEQSQITSAQIDGTTEIKGDGTIKNAAINADNVVIETEVDNVLLSSDIEEVPIVNGEEVTESTTQSVNDTSTPSSDSNPSSNSDPSNDEDDNSNTDDSDNDNNPSDDNETPNGGTDLLLLEDELTNTLILGSNDNYHNLDDFIYDPFDENLVFSVSNSRTDIIEAVVDDNYLYLNPKQVSIEPINIIITAMDTDCNTVELTINVTIIDPISIEYNKESNYIQVTYKGDYYTHKDDLDTLYFFELFESEDYFFDYNETIDYIVDDVTYKDGSNELIRSFKVYPSDGVNKSEFNTHANYKIVVYISNSLYNGAGEEVENILPYDIQKALSFKEALYDDEYVIVYSSYPLVEGKVPVDCYLIVELKEGYAVLNDDYSDMVDLNTPTHGSSYSYEYTHSNLVQTIYVRPWQSFLETYQWFYNSSEYILEMDYSYLVNMEGDSINSTETNEFTIMTEDYLGSEDPLAVGVIPDGYLIEGQSVREKLESIFYSTKEKALVYEIEISNNNISTEIDSYSDYRNYFNLEGIKQGTTTVTLTATNGEDTPIEQSFNVQVIESPVTVEYVKPVDEIGYIQLAISDDYSYYESSIIDSIELTLSDSWEEEDICIEKIDDDIYALYLTQDFVKVNYDPDKTYEVQFPLWALDHRGEEYHFYGGLIYSEVQPVVTNEPVEKVSEFIDMEMTTGQVVTFELNDYFNDSDMDSIQYSATSDNDQVTSSLEGSVLSIEAKAEANLGEVVTINLSATDGQQTNNTTASFKITIVDQLSHYVEVILPDTIDNDTEPDTYILNQGDSYDFQLSVYDSDNCQITDPRNIKVKAINIDNDEVVMIADNTYEINDTFNNYIISVKIDLVGKYKLQYEVEGINSILEESSIYHVQ